MMNHLNLRLARSIGLLLTVAAMAGCARNASEQEDGATPPAAERRFRCHSEGWKRLSPNIDRTRISRTLSTLGITLRKNLRGIVAV